MEFQNKNIFSERNIIFMREGPRKHVGVVEEKEKPKKPVTYESVGRKFNDTRKVLDKFKDHTAKIKKPEIKKKLQVKSASFEQKYNHFKKQFDKFGRERKSLIIAIDRQLQAIINHVYEKHPELKPKVPEKKTPAKAAEKIPNRSEVTKKLGDLIDKYWKRPQKYPFGKIRPQIAKLFDDLAKSMKIDANKLNKDHYVDLSGGYKVALIKWKENQGTNPNFLLYKGAHLICYKSYYEGVKQVRYGETTDTDRRRAEIAKSLSAFPDSYKIYPPSKRNPNGRLLITSRFDFVSNLSDIAHYTVSPDWSTNMPSYRFQIRNGDQITIQPKGTPYKIIFYASNPTKIQFLYPGKGLTKFYNIDDFIEKPKQQKKRLEREKAEKKSRKESAEYIKKDKILMEKVKKQQKREKIAEERAEKARIFNEKTTTINNVLNPKFKDFVKFDKNNPFKFTINAKTNSEKRLVKKTQIQELINFQGIKGSAVRVTIKGEKGTSYGLYYPGQDKCYKLTSLNGKQTAERIKFYNKDTITIERFDEKQAYKMLNKKDKTKVKPQGSIEALRNFNELERVYKEFSKLGLKMKDVDMKPLIAYQKKYPSYDPKKMFINKANENWTKENIKKIGYAKINEIIKTEISVIKDGIERKTNPFYFYE